MKLSDAINLGSVTVNLKPGDMMSCALGAACNAVGAPYHQMVPRSPDEVNRYDFVKTYWPWVRERIFTEHSGWRCNGVEAIFQRFDDMVVSGLMSLEQLIDYTRSIEPSCGDCNRFECTCVKSEAVPEAKEAPCFATS